MIYMKINNNINLKQLLEKKEQEATTKEDKEKVTLIKDLFLDEAIFFKIPAETAVGILHFLGIPDDKIKETYLYLISPAEYEKKVKGYAILKEK